MLNRSKKVTAPKVNREVQVTYEAPENVAESIKVYGEEITFAMINRSLDIAAQAKARTMLEATDDEHKSDSQVIAAMKTWKPELRKAADKVERLSAAVEKLSPEEKKALLAQLSQ